MKIGLDIGFGDVKMAYRNESGCVTLKYPTAIRYASMVSKVLLDKVMGQDKGHIRKNGKGTCQDRISEYEYHGRTYVVGDAVKKGYFPPKSIMFMRHHAPSFAFIAAQEVKKVTGREVEKIGMGLPLTYCTDKNINEMRSRMEKITVNGMVLEVPVSFYLQGYGALIDYKASLTPEELGEAARNLLVIDIGFNMLNFINIELGKVAINSTDTMYRSGVSLVTEDLTAALKSKGYNLSPVEAADLLKTGKIKHYNHKIDCSELVRDAIERYVDWLLHEIESRYYERLKRAE